MENRSENRSTNCKNQNRTTNQTNSRTTSSSQNSATNEHKHASPEEYRASTGFECLLGWLYLNGQLNRVQELFETLWQSFDPNEK